jgi:hypothetical protein
MIANKDRETRPLWSEDEPGVIRLSLSPTDGTPGAAWAERLNGKGKGIGIQVSQRLASPGFQPTTGVAQEIAILRGSQFDEDDAYHRIVLARAAHFGLTLPGLETACNLHESLSREVMQQMGLEDVALILSDAAGVRDVVTKYHRAKRHPNDFEEWLNSSWSFGHRWYDKGGFAFVVPSR